jgi:hypothetical protein
MKLTSPVILAFVLASALGVFAADKPVEKNKDTKPTKANKAEKTSRTSGKAERKVALTGSYIKQEVRRNGIVTDGAHPVVVLDSEAIRNSGAADLREALVFRGLGR